MILDFISSPDDLRKLSVKQLILLCSELRSEIIRITSNNGGHLGSNLGIVEITAAVHYIFDCPKDKLIFDVGHQSYAHKLLTGRRKLMEDLRSFPGASGFPDPKESEYDSFISGHASTSLSAAIGLAKARDINGEDFKILSIIGDGSLSGGMVYEAMNNTDNLKNFIVILNDNQMSISESVGAMRKYLTGLLSSKSGLHFRKVFRGFLSQLPNNLSKCIEKFAKNFMYAIKGGTIFEELGFQYIGPIDGHDIEKLIKIFKNVRDIANYKPVIIHSVTEKGKGYELAENDSIKLHGVEKSYPERFSDVFGHKIIELAEKDEKIVCITAAMKSGCGLTKFAEKFPNRFFDVGIAEEHAVTFAAGLAKGGLKPFVAIYSTFLQRAFDQIFHDVFLQNLPVRFIIDKAGFPGADGKTHSGVYDIALLQNFDNFFILAPSSKYELQKMLEFAANHNSSPLAIRYPKSEAVEHARNDDFEISFRIVSLGENVAIFFCGPLLNNILEAVNISKTNPTIVDVRVIQPFDFDKFLKISRDYKKIIIVEEGIFGGLSNIINEFLSSNKHFDVLTKLIFLNTSKSPVVHCSREKQIQTSPLSADNIASALKNYA
ncbi:MAG: 1-deoxy-D-xylulose-5-phosphate synthase [Holosporales bacterium]|jgi:1-deoxy-D-xylulose-5-phosphate synthase|nr:1-deoxy-D-xylulose-5-phosphate synthase [Holosporales bacterium]